MSVLGSFEQQPAEKLDYPIDHADWLGSDSLASHTVTISPTGPTVSSTLGSSSVVVWVSGLTNAVKYKLTVTVTTLAGRIKQSEFYIKCKDR